LQPCRWNLRRSDWSSIHGLESLEISSKRPRLIDGDLQKIARESLQAFTGGLTLTGPRSYERSVPAVLIVINIPEMPGGPSRRRGTHKCAGGDGLRDRRGGSTNNRLHVPSREPGSRRFFSSSHPSRQAQDCEESQTCRDDAGRLWNRGSSEGKIRVRLELEVSPINPVGRADIGDDGRGATTGTADKEP